VAAVVHAYLVDFLRRGPARAIVYDVLFTERDRRTFELAGERWTGEASDRAFAESVARAGNVILAADVTSDELAQTDRTAVDRLKRVSRFRRTRPSRRRTAWCCRTAS